MGGINSLSGLSNISVDFRPTIETNVQNTGNANQPQPGADAVPEGAPQLGNAKSVVQQLDVLLVNAAGKSVSADAVKNVKKVGESLTDLGVLTQEDMDAHPEKKQAYLDSIAPRISKNALRATERRLNEAIAYAKQLKKDGQVYGAEEWKNYRKQNWMSPIESELKIRKADNKTVVTVDRDIKCVNDFLIQNCPSYFKRDYVHLMFQKPKPAS